MGLSRLDNFLKSVRGTILYVNPNDLDATDSIENQGNSLTRPFKTIQRALIESARFSYQKGLSNDRFNKTTILLYPGDHVVDNRPGWIPDGLSNYQLRDGSTTNNFPPFDLSSNFDLTTSDNELYKLNSIHGGVIIPRGTSIVGLDLRKTKIRPKYVPDPLNDDIERSCIFRITGGCYFWQFSMFDADPNGQCYINYASNIAIPNFSHHKLTCFEYADGVNDVKINDEFLNVEYDRTDLEMYYEKIGLAYGQSSGRPIEPDYPSSELDIQPKIDEYRIVGSTGQTVGITSIIAGDGISPTTDITVTTSSAIPGLDVDTPFRVEGITVTEYNGQFVVTEKLSDTQIKYKVQTTPGLANPSTEGASLTLQSDTVTSASPYIFNISLRSVYGMCGALADGDKANGFKSMVIAQFTGIGLQKDDRAFVVFDETTGLYQDSNVPGNETLSNNSRAIFKPEWRNFHIKAVNDAFIQNVSVFAIGFAEHFSTDTGGDMSITNSNSNFGAKALVATGFRRNAFPQDDYGYVTHIIPPKQVPIEDVTIEFNSIDINRTLDYGVTGRLYLYQQNSLDSVPENVIEGYRVGAKENDALNVLVSSGGSVTEYSSRIVMPNSDVSSEKSFNVVYNIGNNILSFGNTGHTFLNGESIRFFSDNGKIPDGLINNQVYFAITDENDVGIGTTQIKVAKTLNDALTHTSSNAKNISFNTKGGKLKVVSRVSDKNSGDIGHPIQWDSTLNQWYINSSDNISDNGIYNAIVSIGVTSLGAATPRTFIRRKQDNRNSTDRTYRLRYVIPKSIGSISARPPSDGFIIQESNTSIGSTTSEIQTYFGSGSISNLNQQRNFKFIANANWSGNVASIDTELPHNLSVGSEVEVLNVKSTSNPSGTEDSGFNGTFTVSGISSSKQFSYQLTTNPGTFSNDTTIRNTSLPYFKRKKYNNIYYVFRNEEVKKYIPGEQDGVYYLTVVNASNSPSVNYFSNEKFSQPVKELYPQVDRDNPVSDPDETKTFAQSSLIGEVLVDDVRKSITKETLYKSLVDNNLGVGITNIVSTSSTIHTVYTNIDHGLNRILKVSISNAGSGYGSGSAGTLYNARLVSSGGVTGKYATAKLTVNGSGSVTDVAIMDGGSAYGVGDTLSVLGVTTTTGYSPATVTVTQVYNNVGDTVRISGVSSETYGDYNNLYRITDVSVGAAASFKVQSSSNIVGWSTSGIGNVVTSDAFVYLTGSSIRISSLAYNNQTGIATVKTNGAHGLKADSLIKITGANQSIYNGDFVVTENVGISTFKVKIGTASSSPAATGTLYAYRQGVTSNDGVITSDNENLNGRMIPNYAGITTTLFSPVIDASTNQITLQGIEKIDVRIGDYLAIDDEIVRVSSTVPNTISPGTSISVLRGVLGTKAATHENGSVVRRISPTPIEFRRHSISRASGHTFEYVGYGPGNYSTAFPDRQDRQISAQEELLSQSTRKEGGINFYTGMNDKGISYSGNKKLSTVTGQEEIFDTPIQTITGEDIGNLPSINVINPVEASFARSIQVNGGIDGKATSQFNGPVIFTNKLTSTSSRGIEANSLYLQGDAIVSRKYTVGISTPTSAGNPGDVVYYQNPSKSGYMGWVYTTENDWYRFGNISISRDSNLAIFDQVGIGTTSPDDCKLKISGLGTDGNNSLCVGGLGVGIGTTSNGYDLRVNGAVSIAKTCYAGYFVGDGSGITNISAPATGWSPTAGGYYNTGFENIGIGTEFPGYNLELGSAGTGKTDLYVNNIAKFVGLITANNVFVTGIITATGFNLDSSSGTIIAGIVTTTDLSVGTSGTVFRTSNSGIGIGTQSSRANLDIEGSLRLKTYSEAVGIVSASANVVTIDLSKAQTFDLRLNQNVDYFRLLNAPTDSTTFTLKVTQNSVGGYSVDLNDFRTVGLNSIAVRWPGGGVVPIVTTAANRTDIYSFRIFNGTTLTNYTDPSSGLFGVVVGQNFVD